MTDEEIVRAGTRRVVGRETLRRLNRMITDWQSAEDEKLELARRLAIGIAILSAVLLTAFFTRHL